MRGKHFSKKHRLKISSTLLKKHYPCPKERRKRISNALLEEKHFNWKGGVVKDRNGYSLLKMREHPAAYKEGYILLHRYVVEAYIGRFLNSEEIIHHIDKNRSNNLPENLYLFSNRRTHIIFHRHPYPLKSNLPHLG